MVVNIYVVLARDTAGTEALLLISELGQRRSHNHMVNLQGRRIFGVRLCWAPERIAGIHELVA
jgi:hypothetical protein